MSISTNAETRPKLAPLQCVKCRAPLIVVDAPSLVCRFCGAGNIMPPVYREELRLTRDLDAATRDAAKQWLKLTHVKTLRSEFIAAAVAPFVLMTGSLIILLAAVLLALMSVNAVPVLLALAWLLLIPTQLLAGHIAMRNVLVSGATNVGAAFAARPPATPGAPPNCRECGAPLSVHPDDVLVVCIYCETQSIVRLDDVEMKSLLTRVASAKASLAQAMNALAKHAKLASLETRGRTYIIAGLLVLPLIWAFVDSWNSSYWALLIALDVFVLAICVFWNVREAFLPPVTVEEVEVIMGPSDNQTRSGERRKRQVPGTRGWYDNASDKVNFIVPALVTLIFVAIQIIVLRAKH